MSKVCNDGITLEFKGCLYRTLGGGATQSTAYVQQDDAMPLPKGWELAPDDPEIVSDVIAQYGWSAAVIAVDGAMYHTASWPPAGVAFAGNKLCADSAGKYKPEANVRILIRQGTLKQRKLSDAQNHCNDLALCLWNDRKFTDCTVTCADKAWSVHRAVLAKSSPVFDRMLSVGMLEAKTQEIRITEFEPSVVEAVLCFAYTGKFEIEDEEVAALLKLADYYQMPSMIPACAIQTLESMTPETVCSSVRAFRILKANQDTRHWWDELIAKLVLDQRLLSVALAEL